MSTALIKKISRQTPYLWGRMKKETRVRGVVVIGMSSEDGTCVEPTVTHATRSVCTVGTKPSWSLFPSGWVALTWLGSGRLQSNRKRSRMPFSRCGLIRIQNHVKKSWNLLYWFLLTKWGEFEGDTGRKSISGEYEKLDLNLSSILPSPCSLTLQAVMLMHFCTLFQKAKPIRFGLKCKYSGQVLFKRQNRYENTEVL